MNDLIPIENPNMAVLFAPNGLNDILELVATDARALIPDLRTKKGRDAIASNAANVSRTKTYLDGIGKDYVAKLKALPAQVDAERKRAREFLDTLRDEVRKPLTEYEEAERNRVATIEKRIADMETAANLSPSTDTTLIAGKLAEIESITIGDDWQEFKDRASRAKDATLFRLHQVLKQAQTAEEERARAEEDRRAAEAAERAEREKRIAAEAAERAERAERERQTAERARIEAERQAAVHRAAAAERQAAEAAERAEREKRIAAEASEREVKAAEARAKAQAEAAARAEQARIERAERERQEAEAARKSDREHRAAIHNEIKHDMIAIGIAEEEAHQLIIALAKSKIRHVAIVY